MEHKHTPGPWGLRKTDSGAWAIFSAAGIWIATTLRRQFPSEDMANARLIAASPTMYDFVKKCAAEGNRDATGILEAIHA